MFSLHPLIANLESVSLNEGFILAEYIIKTEKFVDYLVELSDGDIDKVKVGQFITSNSFKIYPIKSRSYLDAYALVDRTIFNDMIFFNPLLLLQMKWSENEEENDEQNISPSITKNNNIHQITQMKKNAFFIAAKLCHEISHLIHWSCGNRLREMKLSNKRKRDLTPEKFINNVKYTDFGDMMESKLFGCVINTYHQTEAFGIEELVAILNPKKLKGFVILLEKRNFEVDQNLENLIVQYSTDVEKDQLEIKAYASQSSIDCDNDLKNENFFSDPRY